MHLDLGRPFHQHNTVKTSPRVQRRPEYSINNNEYAMIELIFPAAEKNCQVRIRWASAAMNAQQPAQPTRRNLNRRKIWTPKPNYHMDSRNRSTPPFAGCYRSENPTRTDWQFDNASAQKPTSTVPQGSTAVESALALSDKYAKLSEKPRISGNRNKRSTPKTSS